MRVGSVAYQRCYLMIVQYEEKWYTKLPTRTLSCFADQPIHLVGIVGSEPLMVIVQHTLDSSLINR